MPSTMLEQEAHRLGLREWLWAASLIGSPQQMQILGLITFLPVLAECDLYHTEVLT